MAEISRPEPVEGQTQASESESGAASRDEQSNDAAVYEIGLLVLPTLAEAAVAAAFGRLHEALQAAAASVLAEEAPKKISLAYRIERSTEGRREKYTEAYFGFVKFELPREDVGIAVEKIESLLRADRDLIRHLFIKTSREAPMAPRNMFASKSLEGRTIVRPTAAPEERRQVDETELDKSIDALVSPEE